MSDLTRARERYLAAQHSADDARRRFVAEIVRARARGRTFDDIGRELGLSRSRVKRLADTGTE